MKTQNKKLLAIMAVSAIMTCPVWAADTTVGTTGVTTSGTTGLTGYESAEELAAIQRGEQPVTLHSTQAEPTATEATSTTATASTTTTASGATGYEPAEEPQATDQAVAASVAASAEPERQAAPVPADVVESGSIPYVGGLGDVQVDTSIPGYPIAAVSQDEEAALPYSHALTDDQAQAVAGKVVTTVTIGPLPEPALAQKFLPRLAMRSGDAIEANYVRHDLNVLGSSGLFASVKPVFTPVPEGVALNYEVEMNPVLKGIEFTGNDSIKSKDLEKMLHIQPGTVLNSTIVSKDIFELNRYYANQGYILSHVTAVNMDENGILHIGITEGHVERIDIKGNKKTKDRVIRRELRFKQGDVFNRNLASRSIERIYNTGYFEDVNVRLFQGEKNANDVIMEIDVAEQKTGSVTVGAGYSQSDGLVGILGLSETNLRGTGDKVALNWEFGGKTHSNKNYTFSYTHPWLNSHGDSIGMSIYDREAEYDDYDGKGNTVSEYRKKTTGGNVTYGRVRSEYVSDYVTLETKKTKYLSHEGGPNNYDAWRHNPASLPVFRDYIDNNFGTTNSVTWSHVFDNRDNIYDPMHGKRLSFTGTWAGHGLGGDFDYYKFIVENRLYYKVGVKHVIAVRLMGGIATGDMPYNDLFTLGGADTLRGYEDDEFRGNKMYAATVEYRFPIAKKVQGVLFTDMGAAWGGTGKIPWYQESRGLHYSVGAGLRVTTPIGPIRLDYGVGKDGGKFHFSFGGKF